MQLPPLDVFVLGCYYNLLLQFLSSCDTPVFLCHSCFPLLLLPLLCSLNYYLSLLPLLLSSFATLVFRCCSCLLLLILSSVATLALCCYFCLPLVNYCIWDRQGSPTRLPTDRTAQCSPCAAECRPCATESSPCAAACSPCAAEYDPYTAHVQQSSQLATKPAATSPGAGGRGRSPWISAAPCLQGSWRVGP